MGKNIFKKSSKVFDRDAFYVLLFVCLCIVAVTAVYYTTGKPKTKKNLGMETPNLEEEQPPVNNVDMVDGDELKKPTAPVINQPPKTETKVIAEKTSSKSQTKKETSQETNSKKTQATSSNTKSLFKLAKPVEGQVLKDYNNEKLQYSQTMQVWETHEGIDIACDIGTEVKAASDGKVINVLMDDAVIHNLKSGYGITVVIEHGNGMRTIYSNLSDDVRVKSGDAIKAGQVIGTAGDSAIREAVSIEGSHLHFAVLKKEKDDYVSVDPKIYMKQ